MIELVEGYIGSHRCFWLTKLATDPVQAVGSRVDLVGRMVNITKYAEEDLQKMATRLLQLRDFVSGILDNPEQLRQFHDQVEKIIEQSSNFIKFTSLDFSNSKANLST